MSILRALKLKVLRQERASRWDGGALQPEPVAQLPVPYAPRPGAPARSLTATPLARLPAPSTPTPELRPDVLAPTGRPCEAPLRQAPRTESGKAFRIFENWKELEDVRMQWLTLFAKHIDGAVGGNQVFANARTLRECRELRESRLSLAYNFRQRVEDAEDDGNIAAAAQQRAEFLMEFRSHQRSSVNFLNNMMARCVSNRSEWDDMVDEIQSQVYEIGRAG